MIPPWKTVCSESAGDYRIFKIRRDRRISPRNGTEHDLSIIDSVNWVNVIALTPAGELIMVEQFRHGTETVELEIPGGMIDATDDSPLAAGLRELREETGYEGRDAQIIGKIFPNPAIMSNTCFTVLVSDCQLAHPIEWDSGEELLTRLVPETDLPALMASGRIGHALVAVALYHFDLWRRGLKPPP